MPQHLPASAVVQRTPKQAASTAVRTTGCAREPPAEGAGGTATIAGGELAGDKLGGFGAILGQVAGSALSGGDTKQFNTKKTWPNKPAYTASTTQEETTPTSDQNTSQLNQTEQSKKKSDKEKLKDALRGLFGN